MSDRHHSRSRNRSRSRLRQRYRRHRTPEYSTRRSMEAMMSRLRSLEERVVGTRSSEHVLSARQSERVSPVRSSEQPPPSPVRSQVQSPAAPVLPNEPTTVTESREFGVDNESVANNLVQAIRSIGASVSSGQRFYISNFDPSIHNIDVWCEEVDRAKTINKWSDNE